VKRKVKGEEKGRKRDNSFDPWDESIGRIYSDPEMAEFDGRELGLGELRRKKPWGGQGSVLSKAQQPQYPARFKQRTQEKRPKVRADENICPKHPRSIVRGDLSRGGGARDGKKKGGGGHPLTKNRGKVRSWGTPG